MLSIILGYPNLSTEDNVGIGGGGGGAPHSYESSRKDKSRQLK